MNTPSLSMSLDHVSNSVWLLSVFPPAYQHGKWRRETLLLPPLHMCSRHRKHQAGLQRLSGYNPADAPQTVRAAVTPASLRQLPPFTQNPLLQQRPLVLWCAVTAGRWKNKKDWVCRLSSLGVRWYRERRLREGALSKTVVNVVFMRLLWKWRWEMPRGVCSLSGMTTQPRVVWKTKKMKIVKIMI